MVITDGPIIKGAILDKGFGASVAGAGDVNADGYADIIIGAWNSSKNGAGSGAARVISGKDSTVLYEFNGDSSGDYFGYSVAGAGDVNLDGYDDVIVGAYGSDVNGWFSGMARIFSGIDGSVLYTFNGDAADDYFGRHVSKAGDVNADGYPDVMVAAPYADTNGVDSGQVKIFSGKDGNVLYALAGDAAGDSFGESISAAGDVNGDGYSDVIIGAKAVDTTFESNAGLARVVSGVDGATLYDFIGSNSDDNFGNTVIGLGDVNNDGYDDVAISVTGDDSNGRNTGSIKIYSGADGALLNTIYGTEVDGYFGQVLAHAGDINLDGYADIIVGDYGDETNGRYSGVARIYSVLDGEIINTFYGFKEADLFGRSVAGAGDVNGDGFPDVVVGASSWDDEPTHAGYARIFLSSNSKQAVSKNLGYDIEEGGGSIAHSFMLFLLSLIMIRRSRGA